MARGTEWLEQPGETFLGLGSGCWRPTRANTP